MAAAIIPLVASAVGAISPFVPEIVQFVEGLFGHSTASSNKDGAIKMETAVTILTTALQQLANAGKIPSAPVVDPRLPAGLAGAVQQAVDALKAQGHLGSPTTAQPATQPVTKTASKGSAAQQPASTRVAGMKVTITGMMTAVEEPS